MASENRMLINMSSQSKVYSVQTSSWEILAQEILYWSSSKGGEEHSIFGPSGTNQMRDWSTQLHHGFGQIVDWSWAKNDNQHTEVYKNAFGCERVSELYVLICGRQDSMSKIECGRLEWRSDKTIVGGAKVLCMTYDELVSFFDATLGIWRTK
jgi:Shedu protein SduA, C-terminal